MSEPRIAAKQPMPIELEEGKNYAWCACGLSSKQPFCDGSHKTTDFTPVVFKAEATGTKYMCMCKHTANPGFCDGSHKALD
ncbi:MAG: CDGSH-type Zn-finger protein [Cyclobacteriaceae bacterium]|jgi:CDGSH-type Zn-finger protein